MKRILIIFLIFPSCGTLYGAKVEEQDKVGNFSLPTSQQPGPLYAFGQNIVDEHNFQLFCYLNQTGGKHRNLTEILPTILYGIRDDFSLYIILPFTLTSKQGCDHATGIEDTFIQLEYAFIDKKSPASITQATIVGNLGIPTGSGKKVPHTGFGSPSVFLGATLSHSAQYWYAWIQGGTTLTTQHHKTKFGNQFFYQGGIEGCFLARHGWIVAGMIELFGLYEQKDKICDVQDNNSGGNTFWFGPSLWASSEKFIFELGLAVPIAQHLFGVQGNNHYFLAANFGYTFN